ncbi:hypothetical protein MEA186_11851 [Mesorhizobium amorphae CCNWGS0123]|uniref:Uncharacterized protein n=1 Tax=Mesorhizobium amorphae CCNWGS0123 TaxID=1082933 RepID=G6Y8V1_9HYPH|nr:hypothetical protein A6B35_17265 [Mesorhizobium amorphae CCNWGS0123]EHH11823.1 hypothetical protein MEA186_11851 [Mesorhizobium amorphae CCNWGS0123]
MAQENQQEGSLVRVQSQPSCWASRILGLLRLHLLVVVVMMVVTVVMMLAMMLVMHRSSISAGRAEERHRDSQGKSQPKGGEEGLLHDVVSFCAGRNLEITGPYR